MKSRYLGTIFRANENPNTFHLGYYGFTKKKITREIFGFTKNHCKEYIVSPMIWRKPNGKTVTGLIFIDY